MQVHPGTPGHHCTPGKRTTRWSAILPALAGLVVGAALAWPAAASTLEPRGPTDECRTGHGSARVPKCETVVLYVPPVASGDRRVEKVKCPAAKPYFWNWAIRSSPGIHATLLGPLTDAKGRDIGATIRIDEQDGRRPGESRLLLGCSTVVPKVTGRMTHRGYHPPTSN